MNGTQFHPTDFSPFVDRDYSDPRCDEIRAHLEGCSSCRSEVENWMAFDALFHKEEPIGVPPFQWQRIAATLQAESDAGFLTRFRHLLNFRKPAWSLTLATLFLGSAVWTGVAVRRGSEESRLLLAIGRYELVEPSTLGREDNPFQIPQTDKYNDSNPFAVRR